MRRILPTLAAVLCLSATGIRAQAPTAIDAVPFTDVHVSDGFWRQRLDTMQQRTIRYAFSKVEAAGQVRNFELAGKILSGELKVGDVRFQSGQPYDDAEVYKVLEGAAYVLTVSPDPELETYIDGVIDKICSAQEPDGYLQTNWTIHNPLHEWYGGVQWMNDWNLSHETFNVGELVECALAYYAATGKDKLLQCAVRAADNLCERFNTAGIRMAPGHAVVEMALVRLFEQTGERKYLDECKFFLDSRGIRKFNPSSDDLRVNGKYWQDHLPATQQREAVGHAVRALYFYSGMADWVRYSGDEAYRTAVDAIWQNIVSKKLYITGGLGARDNNEAFGENYELPNSTAYCETCASVANCFLNLRMFRLTGDARYVDVLERSLYNTVLDGLSLHGDRFYYPNRLETSRRGQERSEWFGTSCCPTNLCRLIPSVPGYVYAVGADKELYVNLFIGSTSDISLGGKRVQLTQQTDYPWEGRVQLRVDANEAGRFPLKVRIPGWAVGRPVDSDLYTYLEQPAEAPALSVNGQPVAATTEKGYATIERTWQAGDVVELTLPMSAHQVRCHEAVGNNQGRLAVERGPLVYCAEFADNGGSVASTFLPEGASFEVGTLTTDIFRNVRTLRSGDVTLIPYFARAYRGEGEMKVWIPTEEPFVVDDAHLIDEVLVTNAASERAHSLQGENMRTGADLGWRDADNGGWISYVLRVDPDHPCELVLTHWGSDSGNRRFEILCNGEKFAADHIDNFRPNDYYDMVHPIPYHLTQGKTRVTIRLQALPGNIAGGIFGVKMARQREVPEDGVVVDWLNTSSAADLLEHACSGNATATTHRDYAGVGGRAKGGITLRMDVSPYAINTLMLTYWGGEETRRAFDILINEEHVATEQLEASSPGFFVNVAYPIPLALTKNKNEVSVHLVSTSTTPVGSIYYAYTFATPIPSAADAPRADAPQHAGIFTLGGTPVGARTALPRGVYVRQGKKVAI